MSNSFLSTPCKLPTIISSNKLGFPIPNINTKLILSLGNISITNLNPGSLLVLKRVVCLWLECKAKKINPLSRLKTPHSGTLEARNQFFCRFQLIQVCGTEDHFQSMGLCSYDREYFSYTKPR